MRIHFVINRALDYSEQPLPYVVLLKSEIDPFPSALLNEQPGQLKHNIEVIKGEPERCKPSTTQAQIHSLHLSTSITKLWNKRSSCGYDQGSIQWKASKEWS